MSFHQEVPVPKVNYISRTFQKKWYSAIHVDRASRPTFDLSWKDKQRLVIMDGDEDNGS
jgi:hypothetical protein